MIDLNDDEFRILIVPPWENAAPEHWMSMWQEKYPRFLRVAQSDFNSPKRDEWIETLDDAVEVQNRPVFLVAHSLGAMTVAHWAAASEREVSGALLVVPPDVERRDAPSEIKDFAPVPVAPFGFPTFLVASENDAYAAIERSRYFARNWGSRFINIGSAGHINPKSGFGNWPEGEKLLSKLIAVAL
jgi:predicted alpha/beta hydrolase family esterase